MFSCKTVSIQQSTQHVTTKQVVLGSIGSHNNIVLQTKFSNTAIANYKNPIKLTVSVVPFTKQTYKAFVNANKSQAKQLSINYTDSLTVKPVFVQLQIEDKVSLLNELNNVNNYTIKDYLSHNPNTNIITQMSLALNNTDIEAIQQADAIFLAQSILKTYALQLYKDDKPAQTIKFNNGVVFAYKTSNCCWQEDSKYKLQIVDLVDIYNTCPNKTYRSAQRAKKKINYFKL